MSAIVIATVRVIGFHCWTQAPKEAAHLKERHRHEFVIRAHAGTEHDDRAIEFHELQQRVMGVVASTWSRSKYGYEFGFMSCEHIGRKLLEALPQAVLRVEVWEDGENGALVQR